jgi:acetyl-CoA carboxylase biotin carboxyl carrier protein
MTRMYEKSLEATAKPDGTLTSPSPGYFTPALRDGDVVLRGHPIGELDLLGQRIKVVAPDVAGVAHATLAPRAVGYGDALLVVDATAQLAQGGPGGARTAHTAATGADGLVFRAPTSGRFYGRSAPDKPAFVSVGDVLTGGATICLLEVMKTFHRVTYGGPLVPERARVKALLVADGADVTQGDPLLALEPVA